MSNLQTADIAYVTDMHIHDRKITPSWLNYSGYERYIDYQMAVVLEVVRIVKEFKCKYLLCGGDIIDAWDFLNLRMLKVFEALETGLGEVEFRSVIGNHDIFQGNLNTYSISAIRQLERFFGENYTKAPEDNDYKFHFIHWNSPEFNLLLENKFIAKREDNKINVGIAHAPFGLGFTNHSRCITQLVVQGLDYLLLGDIHGGHDAYVTNTGCRIINPGSMSVCKINELTSHHRVLLINGLEHSFVNLPELKTKKTSKVKVTKKIKAYKERREQTSFDYLKEIDSLLDGVDFNEQVKECLLSAIEKG